MMSVNGLSVSSTARTLAIAIIVPTVMAFSAAAWGVEGEQVFNDVAAIGKTESGDALVEPDLGNLVADDYTTIVPPSLAANFRDFEYVNGEAVVLDGTIFRKFDDLGNEIGTLEVPVDGFPFDCAALQFTVPQGNRVRTESVDDCVAFTVLNNLEFRIAIEARGGGFKILSYNTDTGVVQLKIDGAPPDTSDMDARQFQAAAASSLGAGYLMVGERSIVLFAPLDALTPEQAFREVARFGGERIDAVTSVGANAVLVVFDDGEFALLDVTDPNNVSVTRGAALNTPGLASAEACGLGRRDSQEYSVRYDPNNGVVFASNRGCNRVSVFDEALNPINPANFEGLAVKSVDLDSGDAGTVEPTGIDWTVGLPGDFDRCRGAVQEDGCDFDRQEDAAVMWQVQNIAGSDTSVLNLKYVYADCRWKRDASGNPLPCPIVNCPERWPDWGIAGCPEPDPTMQILDICPLLSEFDESGVFDELAGCDYQMLIPGYLRGERLVPNVPPSAPGTPVDCDGEDPTSPDSPCSDNGYEMITYFAINQALFENTFFLDFKLDDLRLGVSIDPCLDLAPQQTIGAANETAGIIYYNSSSRFGTVNRSFGNRGGVIGNAFCNGGANGFKWSSQTVSLELYQETQDPVGSINLVPNPTLYIEQVTRMAAELRQAKEELICAPFLDPDTGDLLGPLLLAGDCDAIEAQLQQVEQKLANCIDSLFADPGNDLPNCSTFFVKMNLLRDAGLAAAWPVSPPVAPGVDLRLFEPNYKGEFFTRIEALEFFTSNYLLNTVPEGGIVVGP